MKKANIKHRGVPYSAYSDRGRAIAKYKRHRKSDAVMFPRSVIVAIAIAALPVHAFV